MRASQRVLALSGALLVALSIALFVVPATGVRSVLGPVDETPEPWRPERRTLGPRSAEGGPVAAPATEVLERRTGESRAAVAAERDTPSRPSPGVPDRRAPPAPLTVIVRDVGGAAIAPELAEVELEDEYGLSIELESTGRAFELAEVLAGRHWLHADAVGRAPVSLELWLEPAEGARIVEVELEPRRVVDVVALSPSGTPAFGTGVAPEVGRLGAIATAEAPRSERLDDFRLDRPHGLGAPLPLREESSPALVARLEVEAGVPSYVSLVLHETPIATRYLPPDSERVTFVVDEELALSWLSTVRYRLVDARTGEPLVPTLHMITGSGIGRVYAGGKVESDGAIVHRRVASGQFELVAHLPEHGTFRRGIELPPGTDLDLGDVPLSGPARVTALVVDSQRRPVSGAIVHTDPLGEELDDPGARMGLSVDENGALELALVPGRHRVWARGPAQDEASRPVVVDAEDPPDEITLELGRTVPVTVRDALGRFTDATARVLDADGTELVEWTLADRAPFRVELLSAVYLIELTLEGEVVLAHELVVGDERVDVEL